MPAPFFTNNPADFLQLEGLYINEKNPPGAITGVDLNKVGVMGQTVRGPVGAVEIGSPARFLEVYGGRDYGSGGALVGQVWRFLLNKKFGAVVVSRAVAADATTSSMDVETLLDGAGVAVLRVSASSPGLWGQDVLYRIEDASDGTSTKFDLVVSYLGQETTYVNLDINATGSDNLATTLGDDDANLIVLTKIANGRPANTADVTETAFVAARTTANFIALGLTLPAYTTVAGSEGTIAAAAYTGAGNAFDQIKQRKGVAVVAYAEDNATLVAAINAAVKTEAGSTADRMFVMWNGTAGVAQATAISDVASFRSDRIIYCYNRFKTVDPETGLTILTPGSDWMSSILAQTDVDIHPGSEQTKTLLAGASGLDKEDLSRADYIALKAAGICAPERDTDGSLVFVSGVTTSVTSGKTEITRRRSADFLQLSASERLKVFVKAKNTATNRRSMIGELTAFSAGLRADERIIEEFAILSDEVNTAASRATGIEKILWRVNLIDHILSLVLETEIGTGVTIEA